MKVHLPILLSVLIFLSFGSCKKDTQSNPALPDPVDAIIGTYTGTMHISYEGITPHWITVDSETSPIISYWDTSYIASFVFSKVSADSFSTGGLFGMFSLPLGFNSHIKFDSSGVYVSNWPYGVDNLKTIFLSDSIYYHSSETDLYDGGNTYTLITTKEFSGKKK